MRKGHPGAVLRTNLVGSGTAGSSGGLTLRLQQGHRRRLLAVLGAAGDSEEIGAAWEVCVCEAAAVPGQTGPASRELLAAWEAQPWAQ